MLQLRPDTDDNSHCMYKVKPLHVAKLFHRHSCINAPQKIVQSQLSGRLSKAASVLGLHFFLWYLAHGLWFTKTFDSFYYIFTKS